MRVAVCVPSPSPFAHALPGMIPFKSVNPPNNRVDTATMSGLLRLPAARGAARTDENHRQ